MSRKPIDPLVFKSLCVDLRKELIDLVYDVESANPTFYRDNTLSNAGIGHRIRKLLNKFQGRNKEIGLFVLRRHLECPVPAHEYEYFVDLIEDGPTAYQDDRFDWHMTIGNHMDENCVCPCTANAKAATHPVLYDGAISKEFDVSPAEQLLPVYRRVLEALWHTDRKTSRAVMRSNLLEAILKLNDLILPIPVQSFIDAWYPPPSASN